MKNILQTLLWLALTAYLPLHAQTTLINYGANWSYFDNEAEPADQGATDWNDPGYDDSGWASGNAHLGYGDGDEVTTINSNTLTVYVRHSFSVSDPSAFDNLDLNLTYDDGAVVYLNGSEVWRVNMPGGTISYGTFSSTTSSDNAQASTNIASTLVSGTNVLAVEVHQRSSTSSDLSFDFRLTGNAPGAVNVVRGPYLQKAAADRMVIKWRTASTTETVLDYGTSLGNLNQQVSDPTPKTEHEVEITGLSADTRYYYQISNASTILVASTADLYFQTAPVIGTDQPLTVWVLGDCGTANNNQRNVRDAYYNYIGSNHTDAILLLGDNAYNDGTDNEYQFAIFENMYEEIMKNTVTWSCLGNHDGHSADSGSQTGPYYDIFTFPTAGESGGTASGTEAYYSFDIGNIHFISLDSYETNRSVGGAMYNWCQNDIQNTTQEWIVAFWHHPPYSKGSHNSDTESNLVQMRQNFLPMLEANGVDLVLSGHSHSYERSYLLNGHYGNSDSFNSNTHTVGATGAGDGRTSGTGAYEKAITGQDAGKGAVYITAGSSGKISGGSLDHEAMYYSVSALGSCILEVDGDQMNVKFIRETGNIEDFFTINKPAACTVGAACDDGDACTTNDVYDSNCDCAGTPEPDSDGDGVCDALDQCPGQDDALIGQSCNDGDDCTINDVYDSNCGCAGTPAPDSDGDGVCDPIDQCPGQDDALIGQSCNDGDACTTNDVYDSNCACSGTPSPDNDGDGYCAVEDPNDNDPCVPDGNAPTCDPCSALLTDGFESGFGNWNDGGSDCALSASNANTGTYSVRLRDNSGAGSSMFTNSLDLTAYEEVRIDFSYYPSSMENGEDFFLEVSTNGGSSYSIYQSWVSGTDFSNGARYQESVTITGITFTNDTRFRLRCDASGNNDQIYIDDIVISGCAGSCTAGQSCDDGDPCTTNDVYDANCNCNGTPAPDSDGDGVCDALDQCPGVDDSLIGQSCNDGDVCTSGDVYDANCNCVGTYTDNDGDGFCIGQDPDDNDGCNPDPNSGACIPCSDIISDGFESNFGNWNDGGSDCARNTSFPNSGAYSVRLRDNSGSSSSMFTDALDLTAYPEVTIAFSYYPNSMENGEDFFLEVSTNNGSSYTVYQSWVSGTDFNNGTRYQESITVSGISFSSNTRFRIRCDASGNNDQVYIDDVVIGTCNAAAANVQDLPTAGATANDRSLTAAIAQIKVYPNPAHQKLFVQLQQLNGKQVSLVLFDMKGRPIHQQQLPIDYAGQQEIDVSDLPSGLYYLQVRTEQEILPMQRVVIVHDR